MERKHTVDVMVFFLVLLVSERRLRCKLWVGGGRRILGVSLQGDLTFSDFPFSVIAFRVVSLEKPQ